MKRMTKLREENILGAADNECDTDESTPSESSSYAMMRYTTAKNKVKSNVMEELSEKQGRVSIYFLLLMNLLIKILRTYNVLLKMPLLQYPLYLALLPPRSRNNSGLYACGISYAKKPET